VHRHGHHHEPPRRLRRGQDRDGQARQTAAPGRIRQHDAQHELDGRLLDLHQQRRLDGGLACAGLERPVPTPGVAQRRHHVRHRRGRAQLSRGLHLHHARRRPRSGDDRPLARDHHVHGPPPIRRLPEERTVMSGALYRRLHRGEEGYALVVAVILISVMMILMAVSLTAATSSLRNSEDSVRFARTLSVAEAGVNDAITRLGENRTGTSPCLRGSATTCTASGGVYQVSWAQSGGNIVVTADGYYPTLASPRFHREIQVTFEPVPTFRYALYSQDSLSVKNTAVVVGDLYSSASITVDNNTVICGNVEAAGGDINLGGGTQVVKSYAAANCSGKSGLVWANGSIIDGNGVVIEGNAKASAPSGTNCVPSA